MGFMRVWSTAVVAVSLALTGCASKPAPEAASATGAAAFAPNDPLSIQAPIISRGSRLAGRTLTVSSIGDIRLADKEVVLTFDDGPVRGRTDSILSTLDRFGVKATFLMVGQMAQSNPDLVRKVVGRGHSVGSHTFNHPNLAAMSHGRAVAEIEHGERALRAAGGNPAFFRFPYLADTTALRRHMASKGVIVLDVDIDSKDYFKTGPAAVAERTMRTLRRQGKGIILLHDLHARTAAALPSLLRQMEAEGYKAVHLQPSRGALLAAR